MYDYSAQYIGVWLWFIDVFILDGAYAGKKIRRSEGWKSRSFQLRSCSRL